MLELALPAAATRTRRVRVDVARVLGPLRQAASGGDALAAYLAASAAAQFWADLVLAAAPAADGDRVAATWMMHVALARRHADETAVALVARQRPPAPPADPAELELNVSDELWPVLSGKLLHLPLPECCGYDIADLEIAVDDARAHARQADAAAPVLLVGVRTGGAVLAPLWHAALLEQGLTDVHWCSVRPLPAGLDSRETAPVNAWLRARPQATAVLLDDRPDTGATLERVAAALAAPPSAVHYACVGRVWQGRAREPGRPGPTLLARRTGACRLWEALLPADHGRFFERLSSLPGLRALPADARLLPYCPQAEARYGGGLPWKPWNDPEVLRDRRPLVNPKKTPLTVCNSRGEALLHLRFIGEHVFGRAEMLRLAERHDDRHAWFLDGYRVSTHIGAAQPLRDVLGAAAAEQAAALLRQSAELLGRTMVPALALVRGGSGWVDCGPLLRASLQDRDLPWAGAMLARPRVQALLAVPVPRYGRRGRVLRSSLRYACGHWHWQVDGQGRVHRFQIEANWGDTSWPELELAAFAVEQRLQPAAARQLAADCALAWADVRECLPLAALTIVGALARGARKITPAGSTLLKQDVGETLDAACALSESAIT